MLYTSIIHPIYFEARPQPPTINTLRNTITTVYLCNIKCEMWSRGAYQNTPE